MKETVLKDYFLDKIPVDTLSKDIEGTEIRNKDDERIINVYIDEINDDGEFVVTKEHLLRLCDDTLNGKLKANYLTTIAFAIISSEYFTLDNDALDYEQLDTVIFDWDNPDMNFPITLENVQLWKDYLLTGQYQLRLGQNNR